MHRSLAMVGLLTWGFACSGGPGTRPHDVSRGARAVVEPGLEVLLSDSFHLVRGRRVGLVTNQGGVDAQGVHAVERLRAAGVNLVALFSPEHGFRGTAAPGEAVATSRDSASGLPIYSLYGRTTAPTDSMLVGIEVLLVDLPDVGARYFTYLSTTVEVMRSAGKHAIPVIVLDRPNPIGGLVQGNVLDTGSAQRSFVGLLAIPMRHGMTLGELARLARHELSVSGELLVVPASGWTRSATLDETGLPFVKPSPNLATLESLFHYPGTCLFEGTNLSVGRGTDGAFRQLGAPWLDTTEILSQIRQAGLPGISFASVHLTPRSPGDGKYADTLLAGIQLTVTDRATYNPAITAVTLLSILRRAQPQHFKFIPAQFDRLAGGPALRQQIDAGRSPTDIAASWIDPLASFTQRAAGFLIYP